MARRRLVPVMSTEPDHVSRIIANACDVSDGNVTYVGPLRDDAGHLYSVTGILSGTSLLFVRVQDALRAYGRCECHFDGRLHVYLYTRSRTSWGTRVAQLTLFLAACWLLLPDVHKERVAGFASLWPGARG